VIFPVIIAGVATGLGNALRNSGLGADAQAWLHGFEDNLKGRLQQMILAIVPPP
jgi:hypothetical protein